MSFFECCVKWFQVISGQNIFVIVNDSNKNTVQSPLRFPDLFYSVDFKADFILHRQQRIRAGKILPLEMSFFLVSDSVV